MGSTLCRRLAQEGHAVTALSRDPARTGARVGAEVRSLQGSIADPKSIAEAAADAEVIFHAAGIADLDAPARVLRWVHVAGTENVLRAARFARVRRVVHISCSNVSLSHEDRMHWDEKRVLPSLPVGLHARTKLMAEELALAHSDDTLQVTALRPALLWGPDDIDGISRLTHAVRSGAFRLYGGGRNIVATTHVDNLVTAALLAARAPEPAARPYYVTDGEFLEAREFYTRFFSALGLAPLKLEGSLAYALAKSRLRDWIRQNGDASRAAVLQVGKSALFDVSRATFDLGYEAKLDLDARMTEVAEWVRAQGGLDRVLLRARARPADSDVDEQVRAAGGD
ncbi:MAG: steroid dehydrogenase-like protein [Myxococcaceae bacterium]|nr:steroid dehydrogenase-like protein [Myxococcaceae bacterium]